MRSIADFVKSLRLTARQFVIGGSGRRNRMPRHEPEVLASKANKAPLGRPIEKAERIVARLCWGFLFCCMGVMILAFINFPSLSMLLGAGLACAFYWWLGKCVVRGLRKLSVSVLNLTLDAKFLPR